MHDESLRELGVRYTAAWNSLDPASAQIWIVSPDGSDATQLTNSGWNDYPTWSPNGGKIAFASTAGGASGIYVMNPDGSNVENLSGQISGSKPQWSPDGSKIAFQFGGRRDVFIVNADGTGLKNLTHDKDPHSDDYFVDFSR
jgi:TolB protein